MKRILIAGFGRMGVLLADLLAEGNQIAVYDTGALSQEKARPFLRLSHTDEAREFNPDIFLNCTGPESTIKAFDQFIPHLQDNCIIADIASVKSSLPEYYASAGQKFVSLHPMFGPTFASAEKMRGLNCIIISESAREGREFFSDFFTSLGVNVSEMSFEEHDRLMAMVLAVPFAATLLFAAGSKADLPGGTTYGRHLELARGLFSENPAVVAGILANRHNLGFLSKLTDRLKLLSTMVENQDVIAIGRFVEECSEDFNGGKAPLRP